MPRYLQCNQLRFKARCRDIPLLHYKFFDSFKKYDIIFDLFLSSPIFISFHWGWGGGGIFGVVSINFSKEKSMLCIEWAYEKAILCEYSL